MDVRNKRVLARKATRIMRPILLNDTISLGADFHSDRVNPHICMGNMDLECLHSMLQAVEMDYWSRFRN